MATERWIAGNGVGLTWTSCFGSELNSLANGSAVISSVTINNATALDTFADLSTNVTVSSAAGLPFIGVYLYPLNGDGTTYGDGRFNSSTAATPPTSYYIGAITTSGSTATGMMQRIIIPPGSFRFLLFNSTGNAFNASAGSVYYRTYNRQVT